MDNHHAHTIRLTAAWEPPAAVTGTWIRRFGRPSGVAPGDRVSLVIEKPAVAAVMLNGAPLPTPVAGTVRWAHDITSILANRNELVLAPAAVNETPIAVDAHGRAPLPSRWGEVSLEILTPPPADR